jgi:hypothetical protein
MDWFRARKANRKASDHEGKKMRQLAYSLLADVPSTQWKLSGANSPNQSIKHFKRMAIRTVLENGREMKLVRQLSQQDEKAQPLSDSPTTDCRRYELYMDRILMADEEYTQDDTALEYLGTIFEHVYSQLAH